MPSGALTDRAAAREITGPRSLTRLLGLFDALAKSSNGLTLAELNSVLDGKLYPRSFLPKSFGEETSPANAPAAA